MDSNFSRHNAAQWPLASITVRFIENLSAQLVRWHGSERATTPRR